jgi:hypothetical protein
MAEDSSRPTAFTPLKRREMEKANKDWTHSDLYGVIQ